MAAEESDYQGVTSAEGTEDVTVERVIDIAVELFAATGYSDTKLDTISRASGMSKRMIHYHFGDKQGLYQRALAEATRRLAPEAAKFESNSAVPVEGVRKLIDTLYRQYVQHPEAIRLLTQESLVPSLTSTQSPVFDVSSISLHLDKLLMVGQDAGAFRPGISANDVFTIIAGIVFYRDINHNMMANLLGIDMSNEVNTEGMHRLVVDTVLAFLTANIPDSGQQSYLTAESSDNESEGPSDIYDGSAGIYG